MEERKGYVDKVIYYNADNGYTVFSFEESGGGIVCVGNLGLIHPGDYLSVRGEAVFHPTYGEQFKVYSYEVTPPSDTLSIEKYLASGAIRGIGAVTAARIVKRFGEDSLRIIDEEPERLHEIKGISLKKAQEIGIQQAEKKELRDALVFLGNYGISNKMAVKIYSQYKQDVYDIIRRNPYQLADDVTGIGFRKADEIACNAGVAPNSQFRIKSCIIYVLVQASGEGNVYLPDEILRQRVMEILNPTVVDGISDIEFSEIDQCIMDLAIDMRVVLKIVDNVRQVYYASYYYTELNIGRKLLDIRLSGRIPERLINSRIKKVEQESSIALDDAQKEAIRAAANTGVLIITGGPGTGKTTTINAMIRFFEEEYHNILLAAPTGRAAKRMTEATGHEAKTIHRMLELSGEIEDTSAGANFERNEDNPLDADVIIVDEMSMVDMFLMSALLKAITPGTRLVLVGDVDQLPSVGPGNILKDIIASGSFQTVTLNKIFRQAEESDIVVNAHKINRGEQIELRPDSRDFIYIKRNHPNDILRAVLALVKDKLPGYVGVTPRDIQVLTPVKKGNLGVERINSYLQENLNPPTGTKNEMTVGDTLLREGDKVMHIKNNYELEWEQRTPSGFVYDRGTGVFNGDIGTLTHINDSTRMAEVVFDDGKCVIYTFEQMEEVTLAYAITIHKSQGSEYPAVVLPLLTGPAMLMNRNILYTAVTRARQCVCIPGAEEAVRRMIDNTRENRRYSGLKERILEMDTRKAAQE